MTSLTTMSGEEKTTKIDEQQSHDSLHESVEPVTMITSIIELKKRVYEFNEGNIHDKDFLGLRGNLI